MTLVVEPLESTARLNRLESSAQIDHPSQDNWLKLYRDEVPNGYQKSSLFRLFDNGNSNVSEIFEVVDIVGTAMQRLSSLRKTHEVVTLGALKTIDPLDCEGGAIEDEYKALAGSPDKFTSFVSWFSQASSAFFARRAEYAQEIAGKKKLLKIASFIEGNPRSMPYDPREAYLDMHKLGLELGGVRLISDWDGGNPLDDKIRAIPEQARNELGLSLDVINKDSGNNKYRLEPMHHDGFALIRRRRPVADFNSAFGGSEIRLFKETTGLLVLNYLDEESRSIIESGIESDKVLARNGGKPLNTFDKGGLNNTDAALVGGEVFHRVIKDVEGRSRNKEVIPLSSHYVVIAAEETE